MAKSMTPSFRPMTTGQIEKTLSRLRSEFQKNTGGLDSAQVQKALESHSSDIEDAMLYAFSIEMEIASGMFTRKVRVDKSLTTAQVLKETECKFVVFSGKAEEKVLQSIPGAEVIDEEVEVVFFEISRQFRGRYPEGWSIAFTMEEYEKRGLTPVDPFTLAVANKENVSRYDLIHVHHETFWCDSAGNWCGMAFFHHLREHKVSVGKRPSDRVVFMDGWFAGVKK